MVRISDFIRLAGMLCYTYYLSVVFDEPLKETEHAFKISQLGRQNCDHVGLIEGD